MPSFLKKIFSKREGKPGYVEPIILHDGSRAKRVAQLWHIVHEHEENDGLTLTLLQFNKPPGSDWLDDLEPIKKISLGENEVRILFDYLSNNFAGLGIRRSGNYAIIPIAEDYSGISPDQQDVLTRIIKTTLESPDTSSIKTLIADLNSSPGIVEKLRKHAVHLQYVESLGAFRTLLESSTTEQDYKKWIKENTWVFGTEYLNREDITQVGLRQRIDLCFTSVDGYQDVIELKTPDKEVLNLDSSHPGNYYMSPELAKVVGQCTNYLYEIEEQRSNIERTYGLPFLKPRARIIIGRSTDWDDGKRQALRKINAAFHNIEIMTYDHMLARAEKMIAYYE